MFKNINKIQMKELTWAQAKQRLPRLKPFGDADRDGVKNCFDCRPLNNKKQDEVLNMNDTIVKSTPQRRVNFYKNPPEELGEQDMGVYRETKWKEFKN